jgi:putative endonuclease
MKQFLERGKEAEQAAVCYLKSYGYRLVVQNFRCRLGEIDIIMIKGHDIYFIEVKGRWTNTEGAPLEQITSRKMRQISRVAELYLQQNPLNQNQRAYFSVIGVDKSSGSEQIHWIPDAFEVGGGDVSSY